MIKTLTLIVLAICLVIGCSSSDPPITNDKLMTSHIECSYHHFTPGVIDITYDTIDCIIKENSLFLNKHVCWDLSLTCQDDNKTKTVHYCGEAIAGKTTYYTVYVSDFNFDACSKLINFKLENYQ